MTCLVLHKPLECMVVESEERVRCFLKKTKQAGIFSQHSLLHCEISEVFIYSVGLVSGRFG